MLAQIQGDRRPGPVRRVADGILGVEGVIGYAHAPCEMWLSTHTTAPDPSVVVTTPG